MTIRRLAAILAADVSGYSRLMAADEVGDTAGFANTAMFAAETRSRHCEAYRGFSAGGNA